MEVQDRVLSPDRELPVHLHKESTDALNEDTAQTNQEMHISPLYDYSLQEVDPEEAAEAEDYPKAEDDEVIDFRPVQFNQFFNS